jgi:predicted CXXCH cytochrome family protein
MRSTRLLLFAAAIFIGKLPVLAQLGGRPVPGAYRGSQQCFNCHQELFFQTSHRDSMLGPEGILTTTVAGQRVSIFDQRTPGYDQYVAPFQAYFNPQDVLYTVGGKGWAQRFVTRVVPARGDPTDSAQRSVLPDNETVIMGAQWNQRQERWEDFHGPRGDNTWTQTNFNTKCGTCHATGFEPSDTSRAGRWVEAGIGCEACHGASSEINPITLDARQSNEICGSCHTRGISKTGVFEFPWNSRLGGAFSPKSSLDSFIDQVAPASDHFWVDGESKSHHQQWPDFQLSRHVTAGLTCNDCHSPHRKTHPGQLRTDSATLCLSCHSARLLNSGDRLQHSRHTDRQASCIDCHMPRTAMAVEAGDIRSHTFFVVEPQKTRDFGIPSGCAGCHANGPGEPKSQAELEELFREIAPSFRETALASLQAGSNLWTGFALANLGNRAARLLFTLFDPQGKIMNVPEIRNPQVVTLEPGRQVASVIDKFFGPGVTGKQGWVRLSHYQPGLKGFYLEGDEAGTELTGLTADSLSSPAWVTPILWPGAENRVSLSNLSSVDATVTFTPMSPSGSQAGSPALASVPARGRRSFLIQQLFPDLAQGSYLAVQSNVALQGEVTALQGKTLATIGLFPAGTGTNSLTIPHAIVGEGWDTRLVIYNAMNRNVEIEVQMRRDGSSSAPYNGIIRRTLAPGAMWNEALSRIVPVFDSRVEGYMLVQTTNPADRIQGAVTFASLSGGGVAALRAEGSGRRQMIFSHVAQGDGYWTGMALFSSTGGTALVELYSSEGKQVASREVTLGERRVATLDVLLQVGNVVRGGYIQVKSSSELFGFELFGNLRSSILAAVPPQ